MIPPQPQRQEAAMRLSPRKHFMQAQGPRLVSHALRLCSKGTKDARRLGGKGNE
jgi:hypothetical protein